MLRRRESQSLNDMNEIRTVDAIVEPVSLSEAKGHLVIEHNEDDAQIVGLIRAARQAAEQQTQRAFIEQTWELKLAGFVAPISLRRTPVLSVESVAYLDENGDSQTVGSTVLLQGEPAYVVPAYGASWPNTRGSGQDVTVTYKAGYGTTPESVPAAIRHAILVMVADFYEYRASVLVGAAVAALPQSAVHLLMPYRTVIFG